MIHIEAITSINEFLKLEPVWNSLLSRSDMDCPYMTFEWLELWQKLRCKEGEQLILVVRDEEGIVGIVPLRKEKIRFRGLPVKAVKFLADYYSCRTGMMTDGRYKGLFGAVLDYLSGISYKYDLLYLDMIVTDSFTNSQIREEIQRRGMKYREMPGEQSPYVKIDCDWDTYKTRRSRNFRSKTNRIDNLFKKSGNYELTQHRHENIQQVVSEMLEISRNTWKFKQNTAIASKPNSIRFFSLLSEVFAQKGWLNIWILKYQKIPIAFLYNMEYKGKVYFNKIGIDEKYRQLSPGHFILTKALKQSFEKNHTEFDMLGKDEPYKMDFTSERRSHSKYYIFNATPLGRVLSIVECSVIPGIKWAMQRLKCIISK